MRRPRDLREVASLATLAPETFGRRLGELADRFYLAGTDAERQACLDPVPEPTGEPLVDAWIGAAGEHLAQRWGLRVPDWTGRPCHFGLDRASYHPPARSVAAILFVESPPAFRRRRIFVNAEPLVRARFPADRRAVISLDPTGTAVEKTRPRDTRDRAGVSLTGDENSAKPPGRRAEP